MTHRRLAAVVACVVSAVAVLAAAADVKVTPVVSKGNVFASFNASEHWTANLREQLQTGQLVTFDYQAELRRPSTLWPDAVLLRHADRRLHRHAPAQREGGSRRTCQPGY